MTSLTLFNEKCKYALSDFEFLQDPRDKNSKLGSGSFASVKLVKEKKTGTLFALKIVRLHGNKYLNSELYNIKCEIFIHRRLEHHNIIKFHDYIQQESAVYLLLDYAENGNLYSYLHKHKTLSEEEIFRFFYQTCLAVQYLHKSDFMHRDIKPENLLLDKDLNIKLCDFGWATQGIEDKRSTFCGTYEYMAPEIAHKRPYDYRVDIWSLGVLLYELIHGESPYKGRTLIEIHKSLSRGTIRYSSKCHPDAKDLIQRILKHNPNERLSLAQILSHPWITTQLPTEEGRINAPNTSKLRIFHHSNSLPLVEDNERPSKENYDPQTTTNAQSKAQNQHQHETWSDYMKGKHSRQESLIPSTTILDRSSQNKEQNEIKESKEGSLKHETKKVSQPSNLNLNINLEQVKPLELRIPLTETHRGRTPSSAFTPNVLGSRTPNHINTPNKSPNSKNQVFKTNILSPSFKSKLVNIIKQLNVHTPTNLTSSKTDKDAGFQTLCNQTPQNNSLSLNGPSVSADHQIYYTAAEEKSVLEKESKDSEKKQEKGLSEIEIDQYSPTSLKLKLQARTAKVLEHMKNNFKEKMNAPKGDNLPPTPYSESTARTNTSELSYGTEVKSPTERANREALACGKYLFNNEKETVVTFSSKNKFVNQTASPYITSKEQIQDAIRKITNNKGGNGVVKYQIPISMGPSRQARNKESLR